MATFVGASHDLVFGVQHHQIRQIEGLGLTLKTKTIFQTSDDVRCCTDDVSGTIKRCGGCRR
jgi:hypothetical protein